jgi:hypothetical protein
MGGYVPEGYLPLPKAVLEAAKRWYPQEPAIVTIERGDLYEAALKLPVEPAWFSDTLRRLRDCLFGGQLTAYYFPALFGLREAAVGGEFWATQEADDALVKGEYWPFGRPNRQRPFPLYLLKSEFDALLSGRQSTAKKERPLPRAMQPKLAEALREYDKPGPERRQAVKGRPEFAPYHITEEDWRRAERQAPLPRGRRRTDRE